MAKIKKFTKRKRPIRRNVKRGKSGAVNSAKSSSGLGRLIARGVKNLISYLPGAPILKQIADFGFKAVGLTELELTTAHLVGVKVTDVETYYVALASKFCFSVIPLVMSSQAGVRRMGKYATDPKLREEVVLDATAYRIYDLEIIVNPVDKVSSRAGEWTLAFMPFYTNTDYKVMSEDKRIPDLDQLKRFPYSVTGPTSRPLALRYRPSVRDDFAYRWHELGGIVGSMKVEWFGCVCIYYMEANRVAHTMFTAADFAAGVVLRGRYELRQPPSSVNPVAYTMVDDGIMDCLAGSITELRCKNGRLWLSSEKCVDDGTKCKVDGVIAIRDVPSASFKGVLPSLDAMALDLSLIHI